MSTATMYTFPHHVTRVEDKSIYTPTYREQLPLHRPIWLMRTERGPVGQPVYCSDINFANRVYGRGTFDKNTVYHSRESVFAKRMFTRQGGFIVRMANDTTNTASVVLECHVKPTDVAQWERDSYGNYMFDTAGNRIPVEGTGGPGTQSTLPGYTLSWMVRSLEADETLTGIQPKTIAGALGSKDATTVYPIMAMAARSPGAFGNNTGFKMYFDPESIEASMVDTIGSLTYMFQPVEKTYGQDTVTPIRTAFGDPIVYASLKDKAIDTRLDRNVAMKTILEDSYYSTAAKMSNLPFITNVYSKYVEIIGDLICASEGILDATLTNGYMVNLFSATNTNGKPLNTATVVTDLADPNSVSLNKNYIIYLRDGADGDISNESVEALTRQFLMDDINPDIDDSAKVPITHMYDTGVSLPTKKAFIEFLGRRDDVKIILSTQDCNRDRMNSKDEDISIGASLHASCILQPESQIHGTEVFRAEIYQQAAYLADTTLYDEMVPATLDALEKRCRWQSRGYIEGMPKGLPNSQVTMFKDNSWNWTPSKPEHKQRSWDTGLNYFQYYDMSRIHYADMRSVYRYDTSVLSSAIFTDAVVYTKHVIRYNWARLSGVEMPFARLAETAKTNVLGDLLTILNQHYSVEAEFYQTEEEQKIGYITHGRVRLIGPATNRVWIVDVECYRQGYTPEE